MSARQGRVSRSKKTAGIARSRIDWVEAGIAALADGGVSGIRINTLASALGVTKGSFYWHFTDRRALLDAMLERWANDRTQELLALVSDGVVDPAERITRLVAIASRVAKTDRAMRIWATTDEAARRAVRRADRKVFAHLEETLRALGFDEADARTRARLFLVVAVGAYAIEKGLGRVAGEAAGARELELLLTPR